jgi:hypothetical protein
MSWWEIKDERAGVTLALVNASHLNQREARRIGDRISTVLGGIPLAMHLRTARPNPTLVHHGQARRAAWHITGKSHEPIGELYFGTSATARAIGSFLSDLFAKPIVMWENTEFGSPPLETHKSMTVSGPRTAKRRNPKPKGRNNPGGRRLVFGGRYELEAGEPYRGPHVGVVEQFIAYGKRGAVYGGLVYGDGRFHWLNLSRGGMGTVPFDLAQVSPRDLWAGGSESNPSRSKAARARRRSVASKPNPPRLTRKVRRAIGSGRFVKAQHHQAQTVRRGTARLERQRFGTRRRPNPGGRNPAYRLAWKLYQPGGFRAATGIGDYYVTTQRNQAQRVVGVTVQLNTYAKNAAGYHWADLGHAKTVSAAKAMAQADWNARVTASEHNPGGYTHGGARAALARLGPRLSVPDRHRLKIARDTLKMSDEGARIMGGMTKDEARQVVMSLTGKWPTEPNRRSRSPRGTKRSNPGSRYMAFDANGRLFWSGLATTKDEASMEAERSQAAKSDPPEPWRIVKTETRQKKAERNPLPRWADPRSVRTVRRGGVNVLVACPRGQWHPRGRAGSQCSAPMRLVEIKANPRNPDLDGAKEMYRTWSELEPGKITRVAAPKRVPRAMAKLGELVSVVYRSDKYDGKHKLYEHTTRRPRPVLAADPGGRHVFIVGGRMKPTADGLVN